MKIYTDLEQSKKLAEILPGESADMCWTPFDEKWDAYLGAPNPNAIKKEIPCWSLVALLSLIKDKCDYFELVYLKRTTDGRANPLEDVYRLSTDIYDIYKKESIDACYEMILKLNELKML